MGLRWLIKGGTDDLATYGTLEVGDLFWSLPDQGDQQIDLGMVLADGVGDRGEQHGFASLGRRDDQAALSTSNRSHQVDKATREIG